MTSPASRISTRRWTWAELVRELPALAAFRPTWAEVDLDRLVANFRVLAARVGPGVSVLPIVKADAYGHGAPEVARALEAAGAERFAVALLEEGLELRRAGVSVDIQLLGAITTAQVPHALAHGLTPAVFEATLLEALDRAGRDRGRRVGVHIKLDTGMGRLGFPPPFHDDLVRLLEASRGLAVEGVFTNFASADDPDAPSTRHQLERLERFVDRLARAGLGPGIVHASNSAAILSFPAGWKNAVRPGLTLYGLHPGALVPRAEIAPVLSFETTAVQVKEVAPETRIGYGGSWVAERPSLIATLPVGYDDGYDRGFSGCARVLLESGAAPVVGRISMDMTTIDVTAREGLAVGSPVTLIGERGGDRVSADDLAALVGTIPYEILCGIGRRVPRVYFRDRRPIAFRSPFRSEGVIAP